MERVVDKIEIADVTQATFTGTGAFDVMMKAMKLHLQEEYSSGRITGDKYAEAYVAMSNQVLAQAVQFALNAAPANKQMEAADKNMEKVDKDMELTDKNMELIDAKIDTEQAQISDSVNGQPVKGTVGKQKQVYSAQAKGFKDDAMSKVLKMMIDVFSVQRGTDEGFVPPTALDNTNISNMVTETLNQVKQNPPA